MALFSRINGVFGNAFGLNNNAAPVSITNKSHITLDVTSQPGANIALNAGGSDTGVTATAGGASFAVNPNNSLTATPGGHGASTLHGAHQVNVVSQFAAYTVAPTLREYLILMPG